MADQKKPQLFELNNGKMKVIVSNYGCTITSLFVPDKNGKLGDVVLGFDSLEPYLKGDAPYFGCIVGRVANRIKEGKFKLDGKEYSLPINNGPNSLHGEQIDFSRILSILAFQPKLLTLVGMILFQAVAGLLPLRKTHAVNCCSEGSRTENA